MELYISRKLTGVFRCFLAVGLGLRSGKATFRIKVQSSILVKWVELSLPQIRNAGGLVSEIAKFFNYSPKRQHFFEHVVEAEAPNESKKKLKDLCRTRWVQRIDSYSVFHDLYPSLIKTMEAISICSSEYGDWTWDSDTLVKARVFFASADKRRILGGIQYHNESSNQPSLLDS